ncbi:MAG: hybrid sensor histidine kinase/response regulator [Anaerolineae bacterium]|nr:hybrid sensor histidine kinase/response regulator [Anaerolineae bacterium]
MNEHTQSSAPLQNRANILVVDDTRANLQLLAGILAQRGYKVRPATNGRMALAAAQAEPPDLILLDIMMPEMDGFEVCHHLKADDRTRDIPVIFISAISEALDKATAFSVGGVDYITKPFQAEEVLARVNTHLTIRRLQQNLQEQIAELDAFAHTVAHDLKSPLTVMIGFAHYLLKYASEVTPTELLTSLRHLEQSGQKAVNIIDELLLLASVRKEDAPIGPVDMALVVRYAQKRLALMIKKYQGEIILPNAWPEAKGYAPWLEEVWINYLSNGLKYGGQPPRLELGATAQPDGLVRFWMRDNGPGLAPEAQAALFTEFSQVKVKKVEGHGLGLSIVRRIVDKLGGQVGVESQAGRGSEFYFTLPGVE